MNTKHQRLLMGLVVVAAAVGAFALNRAQQQESRHTQSNGELITADASSTNPTSEKSMSHPVTSTNASTLESFIALSRPTLFDVIDTRLQMKKALFSLNHKPIVFYGRVVDQYGEPVPEADIAACLTVHNGLTFREQDLRYKADAQGNFTIKGLKGESIGILAYKKPEYFSSEEGLYYYSDLYRLQMHHPDPANPVVFEMWKKKGAEPLLYYQREHYIPATGEPVGFDMTTGLPVTEGADLLVSIQRPVEEKTPHWKYPWCFKLEILSGGLVEGNEFRVEHMYEAPAAGYLTYFEKSFDTNQTNWSSRFDENYYVVGRGGQCYAKLRFDVTSDAYSVRRGVGFGFECYVNTNFSRNLEVAREKLTRLR